MAVANRDDAGYKHRRMSIESQAAPARAAAPVATAMPWLLLGAACLGSFAATASGTTRAPFLIDMARDLSVSLMLVANLVSMTATAWGITSFIAGYASDRLGRRPFLIGGPLALAFCMLGVAQAGDFVAIAIWATIGGG